MNDTATHDLDAGAVQRAFNRAAPSYDAAAEFQRAVGDELLERLATVRVTPERVVDLGCGTGYPTRQLLGMYRSAEVIGVDFAPGMARRAGRGRWPRRRPLTLCADIRRLPLADASVDVLFSNLAFQWIEDLPALFIELRRVLRPDGVLMFSTFGPDTLTELRAAWSAVDRRMHVHEFPDMHDVGDAVLQAGFKDPVMDVDRTCRSYSDVRSLMRELQAIGARNAAHDRPRGLLGRGVLAQLERAYPTFAEDGNVLATWELAYGHAWGADTPRAPRGDAREQHIPIESIGRRPRS
ncbi:MAG: malonyl-ACP O-methyltransferase BioC [Halofilum sp. (in: g-proteobacteria)]